MDEHNIDYKAMFENLAKRMDALLKMDEEYFALNKLANEQKPYVEMANKHILDFKKSDQINILRMIVQLGALCKTLCEKNTLFDGEEESEGDV